MTEINIGVDVDAVSAVMALPLDAVVVKTLRGVITGWSPVARDLYGYPPEEISGCDASVLFPPGWQCEEADLLRRVTAGERVAPYSTNRVRKDGTIITVLLAMSAIVDKAGTVVGVASTSRLASAVARCAAAPHVPQEDREDQVDVSAGTRR
jgi:PAS domain S-box-containing protein